MNKLKKFLLPIIFSLSFFVVSYGSAFISSEFADRGSYAPLGVFFVAIMLWCWIMVPIFCTLYTKMIQKEKSKYLFAIYNVAVILAIHALPFSSLLAEELYIVIVFLIWTVIWTVAPLLLRSSSDKNKNENADQVSEEMVAESFVNPLLKNKKKKIFAIYSVCFYAANLVFDLNQFPQLDYFFASVLSLQSFEYVYSIIFIIAALVFLFSKGKNTLHKYFLPIAFGAECLSNCYNVFYCLKNARYLWSHTLSVVGLISSILSIAACILMLIGSSPDYKRLNLLRYGAISSIAIVIANRIYYIFTVPNYLTVDTIVTTISILMMYISFYLLATNKPQPTPHEEITQN